jgi:serine protease
MKRVVLGVIVVLLVTLSSTASAAPPNDPYFGLQWGIQQINADEAWTTSTGAGQVIVP